MINPLTAESRACLRRIVRAAPRGTASVPVPVDLLADLLAELDAAEAHQVEAQRLAALATIPAQRLGMAS